MRKVDEEYLAQTMGYDFAQIKEIQNQNIMAWRTTWGRKPQTSHPSYAAEYEKIWEVSGDTDSRLSKEPRICLDTDYTIALVPAAAKVGDVIVQFWGSDATIIIRPIYPQESSLSYPDSATSFFMLVRMADIAVCQPHNDMRHRANKHLFVVPSPDFNQCSQTPQTSGAVFIDLDFAPLQAITASAAAW